MSFRVHVPSAEQASRRLRQILDRGSVNLGGGPDIERLMLMLTRSCELRCAYCFVDKSETGPEMSLDTARRAIDLMMGSARSRLELQLFGGEPTRRWLQLTQAVDYALEHPRRGGRKLEIILTHNGLGLDPERVRWLERRQVMVLLSLDGDAESHRRFRAGPGTQGEYERIEAGVALLRDSRVPWFMNAVLPPAAAGELVQRYRWARAQGVPRLQLNYAVGMLWSPAQEAAYLRGLQEVLLAHHRDPGAMQIFNWRSDCEPVMLSDDLIVDVDGSILHDGAVFLERRLPGLRAAYHRGHLDTARDFDSLRWDLATLYRAMRDSAPAGSREREIIEQNVRFGAAVDLVVQLAMRQLA